MNVAQKIRTAREALGLSRDVLARIVGVTGQTIYLWETGRSRPLFKYLRPLADALSLPLSEFSVEDRRAGASVESLLDDIKLAVGLRHGVPADHVRVDISVVI